MGRNRVGPIATLVMIAAAAWLTSMSPSAVQNPSGGRGAEAAPGRQGGAGRGGGLAGKAPDLLASVWTAPSTVSRTTLRHQWVDVPMGSTRIHTWVEYPAAAGRAPVVLVLQDEQGLDDWTRAVVDQLALEGFVAVAPDLYSGFGPNGGNYDSFGTPDEAMRIAGPRLTAAEATRRAVAVAAFAQRLPESSGAIGSIGFGTGGSLALRVAADAPMVAAAVVFYGSAPDDAVLRRVNAPVNGFYGEDDDAVMSTVPGTVATMRQLGKQFEVFRYMGATHSFLRYQVEGLNGAATQDAWPRATAFLKQQLRAAERSR